VAFSRLGCLRWSLVVVGRRWSLVVGRLSRMEQGKNEKK